MYQYLAFSLLENDELKRIDWDWLALDGKMGSQGTVQVRPASLADRKLAMSALLPNRAVRE